MSISDSYDKWSATYDSNTNPTRDLDAIALQKSLSELVFDTVIELGCGTGKNTSWLAKRAKNIFAVDFSEKMLDQAKQKTDLDQVLFVHSDITKEWPIKEDEIDLITCNLVLEHIEDLRTIFKQASDYLRKNGYLFICEIHPYKQYQGSGARFVENNLEHRLTVYQHHITDYIKSASSCGFKLKQMTEWFDDKNSQGIPRLISFLFTKA